MIFKLCLSISMMGLALAEAQSLRLGVSYSEILPAASSYGISRMATATDAQGNLYLEVSGPAGVELTKLNPAGQTVFQKTFAFVPSAWAVDAAGSTYWAVDDLVLKLESDGTKLDYITSLGSSVGVGGSISAMAVDFAGRAYVSCVNAGRNAFVVRLHADGSNDYEQFLARHRGCSGSHRGR